MSSRSRQRRARQRTHRRFVLVAGAVAAVAVLCVVLVLTWGGGSERSSERSASTTRVSMTDFAFAPDPVVADRGRLEIVNDGRVEHNFVILELGKGTPVLPPGGSMTLDLSDQPAGTYVVICDITGHRAAGMETRLTLR